MNTITVIRLKSSEYNCYVSVNAYRAIILNDMSTAEYNTHRYREIEITPDRLEDIKYHNKLGYIDVRSGYYELYDGNGDVNYELINRGE